MKDIFHLESDYRRRQEEIVQLREHEGLENMRLSSNLKFDSEVLKLYRHEYLHYFDGRVSSKLPFSKHYIRPFHPDSHEASPASKQF